MTDPRYIGSPRDFDFLRGHWQIDNRRLRQRLAGCTDWDSFPATAHGWSMLDGAVSLDEVRFPTKGFTGMTMRSLDRLTNQWVIHWINSADGRLQPAVRGGFDIDGGERGEFYGEDTDADRAVKVRFIWNRAAESAHWEQAFALPGGEWETNWTMEMRKLPD